MTLDEVDRRLVLALSRDGRQSAASLAQELSLSRQAVAERIRALERRGVILGYHAAVDLAALGLGVTAHIRLNLAAPQGAEQEERMMARLRAHPLVRAVARLSGEDCFAVQVRCRRIDDVNGLLAGLREGGVAIQSRTSFVMESIVDKGTPGPLDPELLEEPAS